MMARGGSFFALAFIIWVGWIVMATSTEKRIERFCQPVLWTGNLATSVTALTVSKYQDNVENAFDSFDYGCRFSVWRLLYEDEWLEKREEGSKGVSDLEQPR